MEDLFNEISDVLRRHGVECEVSESTLTVSDNTITDTHLEQKVVSDAIVRKLWPSLPEVEVYHYTSADAASSVLASGTWRLYSLKKRFDEREILDFCVAHNLSGYLDKDENGDPTYKNLNMGNMFYSSFAGLDVNEEQESYFWNTFAGPQGVRFRLRLTAQNPNLRKVYYPGKGAEPIGVLSELMDCAERFGRKFVLAGISRLCAFYLHAGFSIENEVRMLFRHWPDFDVTIENDGDHDFVALPLSGDSPTGFQVSILEIQTDEPERFQDSGIALTPRNA